MTASQQRHSADIGVPTHPRNITWGVTSRGGSRRRGVANIDYISRVLSRGGLDRNSKTSADRTPAPSIWWVRACAPAGSSLFGSTVLFHSTISYKNRNARELCNIPLSFPRPRPATHRGDLLAKGGRRERPLPVQGSRGRGKTLPEGK